MDYLSGITTFFNNLTIARSGQLLSLAIITSIIIGIYRLHTDRKNPFDLSDLFIDSKTRKIDGSKLRMNLAFFVTSWIVIYATLNAVITEWLFAGYLTAWVADRKFSRDADINAKIADKPPLLSGDPGDPNKDSK